MVPDEDTCSLRAVNPKVSAGSALLGTEPGSGGADLGTQRVPNRVVRPAYLAGPALVLGQVRERLTIVSVTVGAGPWWRAS